jgi:hypothetical protein
MHTSNQTKAEAKSFNKPDETRTFPRGKLELISIGGATIGLATFEPGWKWSTSVQPPVKTTSREAPHFQYQLSGTVKIVMDDRTEFEWKAGDVPLLPVRALRLKYPSYLNTLYQPPGRTCHCGHNQRRLPGALSQKVSESSLRPTRLASSLHVKKIARAKYYYTPPLCVV